MDEDTGDVVVIYHDTTIVRVKRCLHLLFTTLLLK